MTSEQRHKILSAALTALSEHFDTVQIVATRVDIDSEQTDLYAAGNGNEYARIASMEEWLTAVEANMRVRRESLAENNQRRREESDG